MATEVPAKGVLTEKPRSGSGTCSIGSHALRRPQTHLCYEAEWAACARKTRQVSRTKACIESDSPFNILNSPLRFCHVQLPRSFNEDHSCSTSLNLGPLFINTLYPLLNWCARPIRIETHSHLFFRSLFSLAKNHSFLFGKHKKLLSFFSPHPRPGNGTNTPSFVTTENQRVIDLKYSEQ